MVGASVMLYLVLARRFSATASHVLKANAQTFLYLIFCKLPARAEFEWPAFGEG